MRVLVYLSVFMCVAVAGTCAAAWLPAVSGTSSEPPTVVVRTTSSTLMDIQVQIPGVDVEPPQARTGLGTRLSLPGEPSFCDDGDTDLPFVARMIALRNDGDPSVEAVSEEWTDLDGTYDLPLNGSRATPDIATISPRQIMGGVSVAAVHVNPVRYDASSRTVRILRSATFRVTESGSPLPYNRPITETVANVLRPITANWDDLPLDELVERGTYLFIVADNGTVQNGIQNLATWRMRRGYKVEIAGPSQITNWTTAGIKAYIQGRYNSANPPLEFVCLAGDANGSYVVPFYTYGGGPGDWDYTRLDGTDILPDIAIGRLCFSSGAELFTITNKVLNYERDPAPIGGGSKPNWYEGAGLFAGGNSGISPVQTLRWVRERMIETGYPSNMIDTVYYNSGQVNPSSIQASINSGVSLWCYRGYLGMSGYESDPLTGLTNGRRLPFILTLTCGTNDFAGDDITERFVRISNGGAVAAIGMSTTGTHTRFNNILMSGAIQGLLREGNYTTGGSLMRAKLELYRGYPTDSNNVAFFSGITSLIGEPAIDIFTDTPDTLHVDNPAELPLGSNRLVLTVSNRLGQSVPDAYVNLVKGTEIYMGGHTDANGGITFNFATTTAETLFVTATKHNCRPAINYSLVHSALFYVAPPSAALIIDDDNDGISFGNNDGRVNPGETIELPLRLRNWGGNVVSGVSAVLSATDPYVTGIGTSTAVYGTIAPGDSMAPLQPFIFSVADYFPHGHVVQFNLSITDDASHIWSCGVPVTLSNGEFQYYSHVLTGVSNGILDPGESGGLYFWLQNTGTRTIPAGTTGYLRSANPSVVVWDSVGVFGVAAPGAQCRNSSDLFGLQATFNAYPGERVPLTVIFPLSSGFADTVTYTLTLGSIAANAPTPPDAYGYWAFDNTDISYPRHPTYEWVEIDPRYGGLGTVLPLTDDADEHDATTVADLPFVFQYYGQSFSQIAVCTNGWLAMGSQEVVHTDFRNYAIPSAVGANGMIAPFWDDLRVAPAASNVEDRGSVNLDQGNDTCPATVISSVPYTDSGTTAGMANDYSGSACPVGNAPDVFYQITPPSSANYTISLCGSSYDTGLMVRTGGACPGTTEVACNDDACSSVSSQVVVSLNGGTTYYIVVDGYGTASGNYALTVTRIEPPVPAGVYTYHDAVNHRLIVEWSRVVKWNAGTNPVETFECILKEPGYPPTPSGDGEILFQYMNCVNTTDASSSNDYATVGIENLDQSDGVLYSYYNRVSPAIPGATTMTDGRAILFTTQKLPVDTPATPSNLAVYRANDDIQLQWNRVRTDIHGNPLPSLQYKVYRSSTAAFLPDSTNLLATVADTTYLDPGISEQRAFYIVRAYVPGAAAMTNRRVAPAIRER